MSGNVWLILIPLGLLVLFVPTVLFLLFKSGQRLF
ncbi:hypothetical protein GKIL_0365 [Gloeobacter kilaueensis JS1]|uniref:Uncharacterized protein n=1 Tax=Gloeobacter kilaueensis (strain ATCC BAA-2537 / CCAP 1431/1 / ULC 316 / JS1) TaxID=1183438 RepID=U5QCH0_GLOK1|nr:hypothetical protein GKIL_0365 [Gloeobacter kilaueensis JS1]